MGCTDYLATFGLEGVLRPPAQVPAAASAGCDQTLPAAGTGAATCEGTPNDAPADHAGVQGAEARDGRVRSHKAAGTSSEGGKPEVSVGGHMARALRVLGLAQLRRAGRMRLHANALRQLEILEAKGETAHGARLCRMLVVTALWFSLRFDLLMGPSEIQSA